MNNVARMVLACALILPGPGLAQQTTGTIAGRIVDDQDAAIPGAVVTASSPVTGLVRETTSDESGLYRLASLPVGTYTVAASLPSFARFERADIVFNIGQTRDLDIILRVAALAETLSRVSALAWALRDRLAELDINPLLVGPVGRGAIAADALIVLR